jgi:hypothetical protein
VEFFGKPREHCQRLLNALQTRRCWRERGAGRILCVGGGTSAFGRALACIMPKVQRRCVRKNLSSMRC